MRSVFGLVLVAGVALAGGAVYMAKNYIGQYQTASAHERQARANMVQTIPVYVADRAFRYGEQMTTEDVRLVRWPVDAIPEGAFTKKEPLFVEGETRPRFVIREMEKDEAILALKVTEPGEEAGLLSRLQRGYGAFSIKVDASTGVSGFLRPGDNVDIYWTGRPDQGLQQTFGEVTRLILEGVQVIAIDQSTGGSLSEALVAQTVTVAASKAEILALTQGQATGRLSLSLVGVDDDTVAGNLEIDQRRLLGIQEEEEVVEEVKKEARVCYQWERRGAERVQTNIQIPCKD
jgi:pilus assembly protein CpaB